MANLDVTTLAKSNYKNAVLQESTKQKERLFFGFYFTALMFFLNSSFLATFKLFGFQIFVHDWKVVDFALLCNSINNLIIIQAMLPKKDNLVRHLRLLSSEESWARLYNSSYFWRSWQRLSPLSESAKKITNYLRPLVRDQNE